MTALDYRHADIEYREPNATYQGVLFAAVSVGAVVSGAAVVSAANVSGDANAVGAVVGSVSIPSASVVVEASVALSVVAAVSAVAVVSVASVVESSPASTVGVAGVGVADVSVTAVVAPVEVGGTVLLGDASASSVVNVVAAVVSCVGTIPAHQAGMSAEVVSSVIRGRVGLVDALLARRVDTGSTGSGSRMKEGELFFNPLGVENRLARFYTPRRRGVNVWIVGNATVTERQPVPSANVTRVIYGGHVGPDLTVVEAALLADAGYSVSVDERLAA